MSEQKSETEPINNQYKDPDIIVQIFRVLAILKFVFLAFYCYRRNQLILSLIPIIASIAYVAMFINEKTILIARYTDWVLTTGIILFVILSKAKIQIDEIIFLVSLNSIMMLCGLFGRLEKNHENRIIWFSVGCFLFIPIFIKLLKISNRSSKYTVFLWCIYPFVWILAEENIITIDTENSIIPMLDVWAKSGFIYLNL